MMLNVLATPGAVRRAHAAGRAHRARTPLAIWFPRLLRGLRYRLRLDRNEASAMVGSLANFGETAAAVEACRRAVEDNPHNVHAYLHMIDLCGRCFRDLRHAEEYHRRGVATLNDPTDVELLESFYLYTSTFNFRR